MLIDADEQDIRRRETAAVLVRSSPPSYHPSDPDGEALYWTAQALETHPGARTAAAALSGHRMALAIRGRGQTLFSLGEYQGDSVALAAAAVHASFVSGRGVPGHLEVHVAAFRLQVNKERSPI
jgi:hypothetical protein